MKRYSKTYVVFIKENNLALHAYKNKKDAERWVKDGNSIWGEERYYVEGILTY